MSFDYIPPQSFSYIYPNSMRAKSQVPATQPTAITHTTPNNPHLAVKELVQPAVIQFITPLANKNITLKKTSTLTSLYQWFANLFNWSKKPLLSEEKKLKELNEIILVIKQEAYERPLIDSKGVLKGISKDTLSSIADQLLNEIEKIERNNGYIAPWVDNLSDEIKCNMIYRAIMRDIAPKWVKTQLSTKALSSAIHRIMNDWFFINRDVKINPRLQPYLNLLTESILNLCDYEKEKVAQLLVKTKNKTIIQSRETTKKFRLPNAKSFIESIEVAVNSRKAPYDLSDSEERKGNSLSSSAVNGQDPRRMELERLVMLAREENELSRMIKIMLNIKQAAKEGPITNDAMKDVPENTQSFVANQLLNQMMKRNPNGNEMPQWINNLPEEIKRKMIHQAMKENALPGWVAEQATNDDLFKPVLQEIINDWLESNNHSSEDDHIDRSHRITKALVNASDYVPSILQEIKSLGLLNSIETMKQYELDQMNELTLGIKEAAQQGSIDRDVMDQLPDKVKSFVADQFLREIIDIDPTGSEIPRWISNLPNEMKAKMIYRAMKSNVLPNWIEKQLINNENLKPVLEKIVNRWFLINNHPQAKEELDFITKSLANLPKFLLEGVKTKLKSRGIKLPDLKPLHDSIKSIKQQELRDMTAAMLKIKEVAEQGPLDINQMNQLSEKTKSFIADQFLLEMTRINKKGIGMPPWINRLPEEMKANMIYRAMMRNILPNWVKEQSATNKGFNSFLQKVINSWVLLNHDVNARPELQPNLDVIEKGLANVSDNNVSVVLEKLNEEGKINTQEWLLLKGKIAARRPFPNLMPPW